MADNILKSLATALGAGVAATAVMTAGQMIEQWLTGRPESRLPAEGVERATGFEPDDDAEERRLSSAAHWAYGSALGLALLPARPLPEPVRTLALFAGVWGLGLALEAFAKPGEPPGEWKPQQLAIDGLHHAVYAAVLGLAGGALLDRFARD